ncbi:MAG TPA: zinc ribbon domain-containing protein [Blastocatellia bacterium]|nr:zinc ribbon domain-containing protein [Blastocatellia bacterium]
MYCPKCAAPIDGVKFCRSCGTNVSLVPQAISGTLPPAQPAPLAEIQSQLRIIAAPENNGIGQLMGGVGFLLAAFFTHFYWLLIPAFIMLSKGFGKIVSLRQARRYVAELTASQVSAPIPAPPPAAAIPSAPDTDELPPREPAAITPPSVVEGTTRHLDPTAGRSEQKV